VYQYICTFCGDLMFIFNIRKRNNKRAQNVECMQRKKYESYIYLGCLHYAIQNETSMLFFLVFSFSYYNFHTYGKYWGANKKLKQRLFKVTSPCRILLRSAFFFSMPRRQGVNFYIMWKRTRTDMNSARKKRRDMWKARIWNNELCLL